MPQRMYPSDYLGEYIEPTVIPTWVPVLIGICIVFMGAITLFALSLNKK